MRRNTMKDNYIGSAVSKILLYRHPVTFIQEQLIWFCILDLEIFAPKTLELLVYVAMLQLELKPQLKYSPMLMNRYSLE